MLISNNMYSLNYIKGNEVAYITITFFIKDYTTK